MTNIFEKIDTISQANYAGPSSEFLRGQDGIATGETPASYSDHVIMKDYPRIVVRRAWGFEPLSEGTSAEATKVPGTPADIFGTFWRS